MTIRLFVTPTVSPVGGGNYVLHDGVGNALASVDGREEAEQVKRAFENVLAPRFTRDEAIAIVKADLGGDTRHYSQATRHGIRLALEALAAAGVFSDSDELNEMLRPPSMSDKLDAAGIK